MKSVVAVVGRANVGKSTLFNRLSGGLIAIVEDLPGTTRDRVFADVRWHGWEVTLVDTAGLEVKPGSTLAQKVRYQVDIAIAEADIILFLVDVRDGLMPADQEIADQLRGGGKPVVLVANKVDSDKQANLVGDFYRLGLDAPIPVSAHHGRGINDLWRSLASLLPQPSETYPETRIPKIAIVGRPNVGKSMLLNAIVDEERAIVDAIAGTTRDTVDTMFNFEGQDLLLIDTAGVKRRGRVGVGVEYYSTLRALRAINRCDVALLVTDATEFLTAQDMHIAGYIRDAYKGMVLVVNKWDLISEQTKKEYAQQIEQRLKFMSHAPVLYVSAKFRQGIKKILPKALEVWQERQKQLPDAVIDTLIRDAVSSHMPPRKGPRQLEVFRACQIGVNPPSFAFMVNDPELVHFSYQRYLENKLRQTFGFYGTSLNLIFKKTEPKKHNKVKGNQR